MADADIKYQKVQDSLRRLILTGQIPVGGMISSERDLMVEYKVSRQTVREALATLEEEGVIIRKRGVGTIVGFPFLEVQNTRSASKEIGIVSSGLDENYSLPLIKAIGNEIARDGYSMNISDCLDGFGSNMGNVIAALKRNVAGLIIFPLITNVQNHTYRFLSGTGVPFVFVDGFVQCVETDCVTTDNFLGSYKGTKSLVAAGCKNLAYIGISMAAWTSRERFSGFQKAIWDSGLELDRSLVMEGYYEKIYLEAALDRIFSKRQPVDGIFFGNHPLMEIAAEILSERGLEGHPLRICSFDASAFPKLPNMDIFSVKQPCKAIGEAAAKMLMKRVEMRRSGGSPPLPRHVQIEPEIIKVQAGS